MNSSEYVLPTVVGEAETIYSTDSNLLIYNGNRIKVVGPEMFSCPINIDVPAFLRQRPGMLRQRRITVLLGQIVMANTDLPIYNRLRGT